MAEQVASRFTPQNKTRQEQLSTTTVGLVALSDFRKRRAEVIERQEREAREAALAGGPTAKNLDQHGSDSTGASNSEPPTKKKKKTTNQRGRPGKKLLSFDDEYKDEDDEHDSEVRTEKHKSPQGQEARPETVDGKSEAARSPQLTSDASSRPAAKFKANAAVGIVPRALTKAALRKEADEREALRRDYLALQEAVKATEIAIPFVFYDGAHIPGGVVRLKKGDFVWVFLDRCRKVGAIRKNGEMGRPRRGWARAGVDDLMLVRDNVIIPHHYDFHFFVTNKNVGPTGRPLFDYSTEAPSTPVATLAPPSSALKTKQDASSAAPISSLEGAADDPKLTKVVDRRWYARNKHIYPASTWQEFEPERDFANEIRKDNGGNTFFFSN